MGWGLRIIQFNVMGLHYEGSGISEGRGVSTPIHTMNYNINGMQLDNKVIIINFLRQSLLSLWKKMFSSLKTVNW